MLSSIHPLGERARNNRWSITVTAFVVGAFAGGGVVGAVAGTVGVLVDPRPDLALVVLAGAALLAGGLDLAGVRSPGPRRQVNERWIGELRGTVYGFGFGVQLGTGFATFVVTWGVWLTLLGAFLTGGTIEGAIVGLAFGAGRAVAPLASGWIDRPSRLTRFHAAMARLARPVHVAAGAVFAVVGFAALLGGV